MPGGGVKLLAKHPLLLHQVPVLSKGYTASEVGQSWPGTYVGTTHRAFSMTF